MLNNTIITHIDPKSPVSEAYRVLRTNIKYFGVDKPLNTIVVTSAVPMEGKTTTISNLAIAFAQSGSKVLLIDGDLRKPKIHKVLMVINNRGLTNYLTMHDELEHYIHNDIVTNLDVLTSGTIPPNPSELLNSQAMKVLLDKVKEEYDIVLLDSPPICSVTDAAVISTLVDGTILVLKSGKSEINSVMRAKETLENVNANIIGVVLNNLDKKVFGNNYYQYYHSDNNNETGGRRFRKRKNKQGE